MVDSFHIPDGKSSVVSSGFMGNDPLPFPCKRDEAGMKVRVAVEDSSFSTEFVIDAVGEQEFLKISIGVNSLVAIFCW